MPESRFSIQASELSTERLDRFLFEAMERADLGGGTWEGPERKVSRTRIQEMLAQGRLSKDGLVWTTKGSASVPAAHLVLFFPEEPAALEFDASRFSEWASEPLTILHDDDEILVVVKPQGLTVHPTESSPASEITLVHLLRARKAVGSLSALSELGGPYRPGIVHRLDKHTSGVMVVAKTDAAYYALVELFSKHSMERKYRALVYGNPQALTIRKKIGRNPTDRKKMTVLESGKPAVTHVRVVESYGFAALVECSLETGRTHQIRVHLTHEGHSIVGDPVYGVPSEASFKWRSLPDSVKARVKNLKGQALHARLLSFDHPKTGARMSFETPEPDDFENVLQEMRLNSKPDR